jgi:hypothetical protein
MLAVVKEMLNSFNDHLPADLFYVRTLRLYTTSEIRAE